jgi:hypothetical protein
VAKHDDEATAIDIGQSSGADTGPVRVRLGEPRSRRQVRPKDCDIAVVEGGVAIGHGLFFDQLKFLSSWGRPSRIRSRRWT